MEFTINQLHSNGYLALRSAGLKNYGIREEFRSEEIGSRRIIFILSGKMLIADTGRILKEGTAYLVSQGESAAFRAETDTETASLVFEGEWAAVLLSRTDFFEKEIIRFPVEAIRGEYDRLFEKYTAENVRNDDLVCSEFLLRIFRHLADSRGDTSKAKNLGYYTRSAEQYMEMHYAEDISIASIAEQLGMDRSYLYRIFKKETGASPMDFLNSVRLNHAKELLAETEIPISEIGAAVGISSASSFFRLFKLDTGISASSYRTRAKKQKGN